MTISLIFPILYLHPHFPQHIVVPTHSFLLPGCLCRIFLPLALLALFSSAVLQNHFFISILLYDVSMPHAHTKHCQPEYIEHMAYTIIIQAVYIFANSSLVVPFKLQTLRKSTKKLVKVGQTRGHSHTIRFRTAKSLRPSQDLAQDYVPQRLISVSIQKPLPLVQPFCSFLYYPLMLDYSELAFGGFIT